MDSNIVWQQQSVSKLERVKMKGQRPCLIWFTGLSGAGKSAVANSLDRWLFEHGYHTYSLDGDNVRHGLNSDLGFSDQDRVENIRRVGEVSALFVDAGLITLSAFISPFSAERLMVREMFEKGEYIEVYISTPIGVCESRDPKGLYKKARSGVIKNFTGVSSEYQIPVNPELEIDTSVNSISESVDILVEYLKKVGVLANSV